MRHHTQDTPKNQNLSIKRKVLYIFYDIMKNILVRSKRLECITRLKNIHGLFYFDYIYMPDELTFI